MMQDIVGLILSVFAAIIMIWASGFDTEQVGSSESKPSFGGKYQYLTIINLHLQAFYYILCIANFYFGSNTLAEEKCSLLQKIRDFIFAGLVFPTAMFVSITFWSLYHIDRELIFPKEYDKFIPPSVNHAKHTLPGLAICLENLVHHHRYPSRMLAISCTGTLCAAYALWIHILHYVHWVQFQAIHWVYPVLKELSFTYRALFVVGLIVFNIGLYFVGEIYTLFLTSKRTQRVEKSKVKD